MTQLASAVPTESSDQIAYPAVRARIREIVNSTVPQGAIVLVASKGDEELVSFDGRRGWHFPRHQSGKYAGHHPADSDEAIAQLEALRKMGAKYLVVPSTLLWWLDYYSDFAGYLEERYEAIYRNDAICHMYFFGDGQIDAADATPVKAPERYGVFLDQLRQLVDVLLPDDATVAIVTGGDNRLLDLDGRTVLPLTQTEAGERLDEAAVAERVDLLRESGAEFLIVPALRRSWPDYWTAFVNEVKRLYPLITHQEHLCWAFDISKPPTRAKPRNFLAKLLGARTKG